MNPIESINMPTNESIKDATHISAHHKKTVFFQNFFHIEEHTHKSTSEHPLQKTTTVITITYHSNVHHLFTQLLLYHNSHTTNSISFSRPPQQISPSFNHQHPSTLPAPSHLLQTTHINHPLYQLLLPFHSDYLNSTYKPAPQSTHQVSRHTAS